MKRSLYSWLAMRQSNTIQFDSNLPDQSTKASDGSKLSSTALEQDDIALANVALLEACFAVEQAAIVEALAHRNVEDELCALGSDSSKGREPKNHHDAVEDDDGDYMIQVMQRWEPLGKNGIQCNDPSNDRLVELIVRIECFFFFFFF